MLENERSRAYALCRRRNSVEKCSVINVEPAKHVWNQCSFDEVAKLYKKT